MSSAVYPANDFGPFLAIHDFIDQKKIPPSAKRLWAAIYGFYREHGSVYLCRAFFARKLNLRKETISRALKVLETIGVITRTGEVKFGFYPCIQLLTPKNANGIMKPADSQPVIKLSSLGDHLITERRLIDHPKKNKEEERKKEQTAADVVVSKKEFSSNEKIALKQKLKAIGLYKHSIEKIISKHSTEDINNQIAHLQQIVERGGDIKNQASWLISAIEKKYARPEDLGKKALEDNKKAEAVREAAIVAQEAKSQLMAGNLHKARELATRSLLGDDNTLAKAVLGEADQILERAEKIERARALVSLEQQQLIRQEEEQRKLKEMRKLLGRNDNQIRNSAFFRTAVEALVDTRLLAAV